MDFSKGINANFVNCVRSKNYKFWMMNVELFIIHHLTLIINSIYGP